MRALLQRLLFSHWEAIHREAAEERARAGEAWDFRPVVALIVCAVDLTLHEYVGDRGTGYRVFAAWKSSPYYELLSFVWWSGTRLCGYALIPMLALKMLGEPIRDYGLSTRGFLRHAPIYGALFGAVLPVVIYASSMPSFQRTYPFYSHAGRSLFDFLAWEGLYTLQFLTLEFFFRGFLLVALRRAMGAYAIFVMVVPYCMIHYPKPLPEVLGAIVAGVVLGTLALRTRSIWAGVMVHCAVAWTMDILALARLGRFPPGP